MATAEAEMAKLYHPYDTLKAIGFTETEAKSFLSEIGNAVSKQASKLSAKTSEIRVRYGAQPSRLRESYLKGVMFVAWGYAFAIWLYVIAMQLFYPQSVYWPLAIWLPLRLDYLGEAAFISSFLLAVAIAIWSMKLDHKMGRHHHKPNTIAT